MNTHFKIAWLKHLSSKPQGGFTLVLVLFAGLVIAVVGATMVVQGMGDQNKVVSQKAKASANASAEAGISRAQEFLSKYPHLATKNISDWQSYIAAYNTNATTDDIPLNQVVKEVKQDSCEYAKQTDSAVKAALIGEMQPLVASAVNNPTAAVSLNASSGNWTNKFRFKNYGWDNASQTATARFQGIVLASNGGQAIAKSDLEIKFPVQPDSVLIPSTIFPGLWVKEYLQAGTNNNNPGKLDAEVVYDCTINPGSISTTAGNGSNAGYTEYRSANNAANGDKALRLSLPNGSPAPQITEAPMPEPPSSAPTGVTAGALGNIEGDLTLPLSADNTASANYDAATQTYYYRTNSIDLGNNESLIFTPGQKVVLFVNGNISVGGTGAIAHNCVGASNCDATDVMIVGSSSLANAAFNTAGNAAVCSIFFWAPNYTVNMDGGGHAGDCPSGANQNGIYWVKAWRGGGQGSHEALNESGSDWNKMTTIKAVPLKNKMSNPNSWTAQADDGL